MDAALKRSKKRVRNVIQIELPYLLSKEILSNHEIEGYFAHASEGGCSKKAILDMHMARWKSIFSQMDKALYDEGKQLVSIGYLFFTVSTQNLFFKVYLKLDIIMIWNVGLNH